MMRQYIRELSQASVKKLTESPFGFSQYGHINGSVEGGSVFTGWWQNATPLRYAAYMGDLDLAKELIEAGAEVDRAGLLIFPAGSGNDKMLELLLKAGARIDISERDKLLNSSKPYSCCRFFGMYQRVKKIAGLADYDRTHDLIKSHLKQNETCDRIDELLIELKIKPKT